MAIETITKRYERKRVEKAFGKIMVNYFKENYGILGMNPDLLDPRGLVLYRLSYVNASLIGKGFESLNEQTWVDLARKKAKLPNKGQMKFLANNNLLKRGAI